MSDFTTYKFIADDSDERIDVFLSDVYKDASRTYIQKLIKDGKLSVNGKTVSKSSYRLKEDDEIELNVPDPIPLEILPEDIPLDIIYEDDDFLIVNKPKGMVVHPACGHLSGTLVNALLFHCKDALSGINGILRPGIVHRIDKDTSGSLIICKNDLAHRNIADQLKDHSIKRVYLGIINGKLKESSGTVDIYLDRDKNDRKKMGVCDSLHGKRAVTHYKVLKEFDGCSLVEFTLETGRTHQIRVSMSYLNHPLLGDTVYGSPKNRFGIEGQVLHAKTIGFMHPTKNEYVEFDAPLNPEFERILSILNK
ncbi:MAG: RluA family pseudouridine synthase [Lachnospiraceae bacterium]|nr:RluA family pseudouridine synthase [Lachnospiraceae bacterium]